jgi:hypothetical protein
VAGLQLAVLHVEIEKDRTALALHHVAGKAARDHSVVDDARIGRVQRSHRRNVRLESANLFRI